jgi:GNAT superfamily N-acetyltransferase
MDDIETAGMPAGPRLEDGWSTMSPATDNVLLDASRAMVEAYADLGRAVGGAVVDHPELGLYVMDMRSPCLFGNQAHLTRPLTDAEVPAVVQALRAGYQPGGGPYLVFSSWPTSDLRPHGFHLAGHPPLMLRPRGTAPAALTVAGLRIVEVRTEAELADFERALVEGYPAPALQPWTPQCFYPPAALDTGWHFYVGYEGDRAVATASAWVGEWLTLVEMVSTRPECRGRGYGAAITAVAQSADPANPAVLLASDPGRPVYEGLGYIPLLRFTLWTGTR